MTLRWPARPYREDRQSLNNVFVRIGGEMAPISQFVTLTKIYAPESLTRFNLFPCIKVNGRAAEGYSSGEAIRTVGEVASATLPVGYGYDFGGIAREEAGSTGNTTIIFVICFVLIYLQTGLVMLISLLAKTSILITEYAVIKRRQGLGIAASALYATKERFRPIMMTVLTMIVGLFPLVIANGVGANGNNTLGAGVIGGMFLGTLGILFMVPSLGILSERQRLALVFVQLQPAALLGLRPGLFRPPRGELGGGPFRLAARTQAQGRRGPAAERDP